MKKFISGMLFVIVGWPLLENTMQVFAQYTECLKAKMALKVYKLNEQMGLTDKDEVRHRIGFSAPTESYDLDEEEET